MFYLALAVCTVLLVVALVVGRFVKKWQWVAITASGFTLAYVSLGSPVLVCQTVLLAIVAVGMTKWNWSYRTFAFWSTACSVAVFGVFCLIGYRELNSYGELRASVPMEPLAQRLPPLRRSSGDEHKTNEARKPQYELEVRMDASARERALYHLHERTMETFVNSSGFGVRRIIFPPTAERVKPPAMVEPIPQPDLHSAEPGTESLPTKKSTEYELATLHLNGIIDFVNPLGFGYVTKEKQLFGFQPHHFRKLPKTDGWKVRSIELVSLLLQEDPRVYATTDLPRMDKIRTVPTRSLDRFEAAGLLELKTGEDFFTSESATGVRMLGAIRSIEQCVGCHGGERGDLLGAFSYFLKSESASR
jgi:hypothetical protein